jgi:hypothetical protein
MNIKKPVNPKVAVVFPDAPKKIVTPSKAPFKGAFKDLFRRMRKTTK